MAKLGFAYNRTLPNFNHRFCILGWRIVVHAVHDNKIEGWNDEEDREF